MAQAEIAKQNSPIPNDVDPAETAEWLESLDYVLERKGPERVQQLLAALEQAAIRNGVELPFTATTPYVNTIPHEKQPRYPGKRELERRIKSFIRWNAMAMVVRANRDTDGIGGHISTYASSANLYEVAMNHFFRGRGESGYDGDQIYFQGHASPGMYSRAFLEGRLTEENLDQLPPRAATRRRLVVVSASLADARVLGVPDGLDGPRPDHGDLPGPIQSLPHRSRHRRPVEEARLGVPGRRRMRRARVARRDHARLTREARQSDLRHQLQPAAARRPGARQRQDDSRTRRRVPRRRLERHQSRLGRRLGSAARSRRNRPAAAAHDGSAPTASTKSTSSRAAITSAKTSSASIPNWPRW